MTITHGELIKRAERWLRNTMRCGVVLTEEYSTGMEIPDAIGWKSHESYLVECKIDRTDFLRDRNKFVRRSPDHGMGDRRYYMTPPELVQPDEIPDTWGLLWVYPKRVKVVRDSYGASRHRTALNERPLMYKVLRQVLEQV